jgi:hypothetical protein
MKGQPCLAGPSGCTKTLLVVIGSSPPFQNCLEVENDASGGAQVVLRLPAEAYFWKTRRQIINFEWTQAEMAVQSKIEAAAERRRECVVRLCGAKQIGIAVGRAKQRLDEGMYAPDVMEGDARPK